MTGNGDFDQNRGNFGDCVLKLDKNLNVAGFFSPHNNVALNAADLDLGSGGILIIPGSTMIIGGGKEAILYLMDETNPGGFDLQTDHVLQKFAASATDGKHNILGSPVFWRGHDGPRIYIWTENDNLKAFQMTGNRFNP